MYFYECTKTYIERRYVGVVVSTKIQNLNIKDLKTYQNGTSIPRDLYFQN